MERIAQIFKALGDETRLKILLMVSKRRICAKGISKHLAISEAAVSQHISILKSAGIITGRKLGYFVHYDLQEAVLIEITDFLDNMYNRKDSYSCKLEVDIPDDCKVICKGKKCCENKGK